MSDILDYIAWRGDLTLDRDPFNSIDSLIFTALVYVDFHAILPAYPTSETMRLQDALEAFQALPPEEQHVRTADDYRLVAAMAAAPRYKDLLLTQYADHYDPSTEKQFAAMTILLPCPRIACVVYRGTDYTLVGWKEDFNMAFQPVIPSQEEAAEYLRTVAASCSCPLILNGHSKGGNLAVYAAAVSDPALQKRIRIIYNHDGPGFHEHLLKSSGFRRIEKRIQSETPQSSVVGMLLNHRTTPKIVRSLQTGLQQHNPYNWQVIGKEFDTVESTTVSSKILDESMTTWLSALSDEQREELVNDLYNVLCTTGAETLEELPRLILKHHGKFNEALKNLSPESRQMIRDILNILAEETRETVRGSLNNLAEETRESVRDSLQNRKKRAAAPRLRDKHAAAAAADPSSEMSS